MIAWSLFLVVVICTVLVLVSRDQDEKGSDPIAYVPENTQRQTAPTLFPSVTEKETAPSTHTISVETEVPPNTSSVSEEMETVPQIMVVQEPVSQEDIDAYAPVIQQYREVMLMDSEEFRHLYFFEQELDLSLSIGSLERMVNEDQLSSVVGILDTPILSDRFPYVSGSTMSLSKTYDNGEDFDPTVYHYAYYNIDGSRSHELLIGAYNDYRDDYAILAIYTLSGNEPRLLQAISDDDRWHLTIYSDGTICKDGSGGASVHYWTYYRLDDTFDLDEEIASFMVNYSHSKGEYMANAVDGYEATLTPVEDILWEPFPKL